jgi:putative transposase
VTRLYRVGGGWYYWSRAVMRWREREAGSRPVRTGGAGDIWWGWDLTVFKGKYRVETARLQNWDYASAGWYFVTVCTRNRVCFFGEVTEGQIRLSAIGQIVAEEWQKTAEVRDAVTLDEWVVLPNHLHGIIVISGGVTPSSVGTEGVPGAPPDGRASAVSSVRGQAGGGRMETGHRPVSTAGANDGADATVPPAMAAAAIGAGTETGHRPVSTTGGVDDSTMLMTDRWAAASNLRPGSLGAIVGQFKAACTRRIWAQGCADFAWQPRFYDHVIRDDQSLAAIRTYIRNNPLRWELDEENPAGGAGSLAPKRR